MLLKERKNRIQGNRPRHIAQPGSSNGAAAGMFYPMSSTLFQRSVPKEYHGRFFSFRGMMDRIMFQVVLLSTGFLLDWIGFKGMVLSFGSLSFLLVVFFTMKQIKEPLIFRDTQRNQTM
jgi:MFS-type transporter involved in bile tolerance (Atg22 family)